MNWKRWIAILLACSLLAGLLPVSVLAEESEPAEQTETLYTEAEETPGEAFDFLSPEDMIPSAALPEPETQPVKLTASGNWITVEGIEGGQICFDSATGTITDCETSVARAEIPSQIDGVDVVGIGSSAFYNCTGLTSITIPDSVTSIGGSAFRYCTGLTSITIPDSVTSIGDNVFRDCTRLTNIDIKNKIIGYSMFSDCTGLTSVTIPDSVTSIGGSAFSGCTGLTSITIPDSVTSIGSSAFWGCTGLTSITIPDSVTSIGDNVFRYCTRLTNIDIKNKIIGYGMFINCTSLTTITIPASVTSIGDCAFDNCTGLTSVTIPDSVTSIGDYAFSGCTGLTSITIPDSVTSIGDCAFDNCTGLTSVTIPDSVTSIGDYAFYHCTGLTSITIPDSVTSIGYEAFRDCTRLTNITIPESMTSIGNYAFCYCTGLTDIDIKNKIIGYGMFYGCTGLTSITIPDSVTSIGNCAFSGCTGLTSIAIPDSVTSIGSSAFSGCTGLTSITIPASVTSIGYGMFYGCTGLTSITIPDSVTSIGEVAFADCTGLTSVTIPDSVTSIGGSAFSGCTGLTSITIPDSVTSIGSYAFSNCFGLTDIDIKNKIIGYGMFYGCTGLTSITIPDSVTSIGDWAFSGCTGLTSITIPDSVTSIGDYAFYRCTGLTSVTIPDSVTSIGSSAFSNCNKELVIFVRLGSYAEQYAIDNNFSYDYINEKILSLSVVNPNSEKLTSGYTVNWYEKGSDTILGTGNTLNNIDETKQYQYEIVLGEALACLYYQPERQDAVVSEDSYEQTCQLEAIPNITVSGTVTDENGDRLAGVQLQFTQKYSETVKKTVSAETDANGAFSVSIGNVPSTLHYSLDGYYSRTKTILRSPTAESSCDMGTVTLQTLPENKITLTLTRTSAVRAGEEATTSPLSNFNHLSFTIYNETEKQEITDFTAQYPNLILGENAAEGGDVLSIQVADTESGMTAPAVSVTLDDQKTGSGTVAFLENGRFEVSSVVSTADCRVMVFREDGSFVRSHAVSDGLNSDALPDGTYTLIFLSKTDLLRNVETLSKLSEFGLKQGTDYLEQTVKIEAGTVSELGSVTVPALDESRLYYTVAKNTGFAANSSSIAAGRYVVLRCTYEIDSRYQTEQETVTIQLPESVSFTNGSLTLDGKVYPYTLDGNTVTIHTNQAKGVVRFYGIAEEAGEKNLNATLSFRCEGSSVTQPIGTATFTAEAAKIVVPEKTGRQSVTVSGTTLPKSTVTVYDNNTAVGTATANAAGSWQLKFDLIHPCDYSFHNIYGEIENDRFSSKVKTEVERLIYDADYIQVSKVTMINTGDNGENVTVFDFIHPSSSVPSYRFWPGRYPAFSFKVEFTGGDDSTLSNVYVVTENSAGEKTYVPVTYDKKTGLWIGTHNYKSAGEVPNYVNVVFNLNTRTEIMEVLGNGQSVDPSVEETLAEIQDGSIKIERIDIEDSSLSDDMNKAIEEYNSAYDAYVDAYKEFVSNFQISEENGNSKIAFSGDGIEIESSVIEEIPDEGYSSIGLTNGDVMYVKEELDGKEYHATIISPVYSEAVDGYLSYKIQISDVSKAYDAFSGIAESVQHANNIYADLIEKSNALISVYNEETNPVLVETSNGLVSAYNKKAGSVSLSPPNTINTVIGYLSNFSELTSLITSPVDIGMNISQSLEGLRKLNDDYTNYGTGDSRIEKNGNLQAQYGLAIGLETVKLTWAMLSVGSLAVVAMSGGPILVPVVVGGLVGLAVSVGEDMYIQHLDRQTDNLINGSGGSSSGSSSGGSGNSTSQPARPILDPSGYVYEAVPSNRVEGVKAEAYCYDYALDEFGIPAETKSELLWNAEDYDQVNPLYTDKSGCYAWDVPMGQWLVKFSKEGYYDTDSRQDAAADAEGYLPVPPPQTEVNTAIVSKKAPTVDSINIYKDKVQVIFSQYMQLDSINNSNLKVTSGGQVINGTWTPANAEYDYEQVHQYATTFLFTPETNLAGSTTVTVGGVKNYAGTAIANRYSYTDTVAVEPESLSVSETLHVSYDSGAMLQIQILPKEAGANQTITVSSSSPSIAKAVKDTVTTDAEGTASVMIHGELPGEAELTVCLNGTDLTATTRATVGAVETTSNRCETVTASVESGSVVEKGTAVTLTTETEGADIYYTLDGSCPCSADNAARVRYTAPIVITEDTFLIACAVKAGMEDSNTAGFLYSVPAPFTVTKEGEDVVAVKTHLSGNEAGFCMAAVYDASGRMLAVGTTEVAADAGDVTISIRAVDLPKNYTVKMFLLNRDYVPVQEVYSECFS